MSYDLYFTAPEITYQQFADYFSTRPHYQLNEEQAFYQNEGTDVYFSFDYTSEDAEAEEPAGGHVSFNINFYRPHFFGLEAEPEVRALVDHFGFEILDPQNDGMGEGPYASEGFLRGWNAGNEFGYRAILGSDQPPESVDSWPTEELDSMWRWNCEKVEHQNRLGEDYFVPRIMAIRSGPDLASVAVWLDAMPCLIPRVDYLMIGRKELAPRRFFRRTEDSCLVPLADALPLIERFATRDCARPAFFLHYASPPAEILQFVRALIPLDEKLEAVSLDQILNRELVEKHRKT